MSAVLHFDEAAHRYTLGGVELPSVTHILDDVLQEYAGIDPVVLKRAQDRGTAVHKACELHDADSLDYASLDPIILPYLEGYVRFLHDTQFVPEAVEAPVSSQKFGYAGTLDRIGTARRAKRRWLVDIKSPTTVSHTVGPQTAAYEQAARERLWFGPKEKVERYALQLRDDGRYRLIPCQSPSDFSVFLSALTIYKFKRGQ